LIGDWKSVVVGTDLIRLELFNPLHRLNNGIHSLEKFVLTHSLSLFCNLRKIPARRIIFGSLWGAASCFLFRLTDLRHFVLSSACHRLDSFNTQQYNTNYFLCGLGSDYRICASSAGTTTRKGFKREAREGKRNLGKRKTGPRLKEGAIGT
jgi:hypothetical protein